MTLQQLGYGVVNMLTVKSELAISGHNKVFQQYHPVRNSLVKEGAFLGPTVFSLK